MRKTKLINRRQAIFAGLTSAGAFLLSGCLKKAPPTYGNILRMGDDLTYIAQRGLLSQRALAPEYQRSEITSFPVTDIGDPADPANKKTYNKDYQQLLHDNFKGYTLTVEGSVARPGKYSLNNPFTKSWSRDISEKGLAAMVGSGKGEFIAFAAHPGKTASDGNHRNGTYTEAILKYITITNLTIDEIFTRVNSYVKKTTIGEQAPFKNSSLSSDYCFSVTLPYRSNGKLKTSNFQKLNSSLLLSPDESSLITIDNEKNQLIVRDRKSLNIVQAKFTGLKHSDFMITKSDGTIYVADSLKNIATGINFTQNTVDSLKLPHTAVSIAFSSDEKKLYACGNSNNSGLVSINDLQLKKTTKTIPIKYRVSGMAISPDAKRLYVLSSPNFKTLVVIDLKSEKIINEVRNLDIGQATGVSSDNKKIYISTSDDKGIGVFSLNNFRLLKIIPVSASSFEFTRDAKYVFVIDNKRIIKIDCNSDEPIYDYPFASHPKGVVLTNDEYGFVWLPNEQYLFNFPLSDTTRIYNNIGNESELRLKKFKEKLRDDGTADDVRNLKIRQKDTCEKMRSFASTVYNIIFPFVKNFVNDLDSVRYFVDGGTYPFVLCPEKQSNFQCGIRSSLNGKYRVLPTFILHFLEDSIVLGIRDEGTDNESVTYKISKSDIEVETANNGEGERTASNQPRLTISVENNIKRIVKKYFIDKIEQLHK